MSKSKSGENDASPKDINSLFLRAGMIGAKYREFTRAGASTPTERPKPVPPPPPVESTGPYPTARRPTPISVPSAPKNREAVGGGAGMWASFDRLFSERAVEAEVTPPPTHGVKVAILSLAGGVGKTTIAAGLARILSGVGRQVLVADGGVVPMVPHHFGPREQRLGPLEFLYPPPSSGALPIGMFRLSPGELHTPKLQEILEQVEASGSTLFLDVPTLQSAEPPDALEYADRVLVPVIPDVHSAAGLAYLMQILSSKGATASDARVHYVLNRFDEGRVVHREFRERVADLLGERLLPVVVHEEPAVEEAAAHGLTIIDFRPECQASRDMTALADWLLRTSQTGAAARWEAAV